MRLLISILVVLVALNIYYQFLTPAPNALREIILIGSIAIIASDCLVYLYCKKGGK